MSRTLERLTRSFMIVKAYLQKAQDEGTLHTDEVVFQAARRIGMSIQIAGKGLREAAEDENYLEVMYYLTHLISVSHVMDHLLEKSIMKDFNELREAQPEDFL